MDDDLFPDEPFPGGWTHEAMDELLRWMVDSGASDVKLTPRDPVMIRVSGRWRAATREAPTVPDMALIIDMLSRQEGLSSRIMGGQNEDFSYECPRIAGSRRDGYYRFRGNATSALGQREKAYSLTFRAIPEEIMPLGKQGVSDDLRSHLFPEHGLISISGVMGSGKTTFLAAVIKHIRQTLPWSVMTVEKPIEFDYGLVEGAQGPLEQMEVPGMVTTFKRAIESSTRKAVDALLVGETNDKETMEAMIHAAEIGILVYHTIHTQSVSGIPTRIIHQFGAEEAPGIAASFLGSSRVMIQQRLVPRAGGGRVALREWLVVTDEMRQKLLITPVERLQAVVEEMVQAQGRPLLAETRDAFEQGLIARETLQVIEAEKA